MDVPGVERLSRPRSRPARPGDLLVSAPSLRDPSFCRTVVYLLQHDDDGSAGVILNRRFDGALLGLELPDWVDDAATVAQGGPVSADSVLALARTESAPEGARRSVGPGVCVVDLDALEEAEPIRPLRLFVGYAGWSPGQLGDELARDDWLVVPGTPDDVVGCEPEEVWPRVLRRQRGSARYWATLPEVIGAN